MGPTFSIVFESRVIVRSNPLESSGDQLPRETYMIEASERVSDRVNTFYI